MANTSMNQAYVAVPFTRAAVPNSLELTRDSAIRSLADISIAITNADAATIALVQDGRILVRATAGQSQRQIGACINTGTSNSDLLLASTLEPVFCVNADADDRVNAELCRSMGLRSIMVLPLCGRGALIGLLEVCWRVPYGFTNRDIGTTKQIGDLILRLLNAEDSAETLELAKRTPAPIVATQRMSVERTITQPVTPASFRQSQSGNMQSQPSSQSFVPQMDRALMGPTTRIEVTISPSEVEEELTTISPVANVAEPKLEEKRRSYHWAVISTVLLIASLTAGVWWKVQASQPVRVVPNNLVPASAPVPALATAPPPTQTEVTSPAIPNSNSTTTPAVPAAAVAGPVPSAVAPAVPTGDAARRITGIHYSSADGTNTVVLDLDGQPKYEAHQIENPSRVFFDLENTSVVSNSVPQSILVNENLLSRIRSGTNPTGTRIVLDTTKDVDYSTRVEANPSRLVIDLRNMPSATK